MIPQLCASLCLCFCGVWYILNVTKSQSQNHILSLAMSRFFQPLIAPVKHAILLLLIVTVVTTLGRNNSLVREQILPRRSVFAT